MPFAGGVRDACAARAGLKKKGRLSPPLSCHRWPGRSVRGGLVGGSRRRCGWRSRRGRCVIAEVRVDGLDGAVLVVLELDRLLHVAQVADAIRPLRVVIEDVPLAI